ncbi:hypothetical protein [Eubacterium sp. AB3007]|uniref:hypothetical protein n=1 Tax=Eubacterium sp. AB3007 TaxID=1392487 RepID=UPI001639FC2C|nr:hypothetical protein [Eubacterium sp. AB3007]
MKKLHPIKPQIDAMPHWCQIENVRQSLPVRVDGSADAGAVRIMSVPQKQKKRPSAEQLFR